MARNGSSGPRQTGTASRRFDNQAVGAGAQPTADGRKVVSPHLRTSVNQVDAKTIAAPGAAQP